MEGGKRNSHMYEIEKHLGLIRFRVQSCCGGSREGSMVVAVVDGSFQSIIVCYISLISLEGTNTKNL